MPRRRSNPLALAVLACLTDARCTRTRWPPPCAPGPGRQHPPELRLALRRRRDPAEAGSDRGAGGGAGRSAARAHRLPHHRRRPGRGRRVDGGAARDVGQGVPPVRGRALADGGAPAATGSSHLLAPTGRRVAGAAVRARRHRRGRDAATACPACSSSRWTTSARSSTPTARSPNSSPATSSRNRLDGVTFWKSFQPTHATREEQADT